jgi:voltage-gated potassium channel Kch
LVEHFTRNEGVSGSSPLAGSPPFAPGELGAANSFAGGAAETSANFLYFAFVTMTTVGYGDLSAAEGIGRAFAIALALLGQIYLITVVAVIVSNLGASGDQAPDT